MSIYIVSKDNISYPALMSEKFHATLPACFYHAALLLLLLGLSLFRPAPSLATGPEAGEAEEPEAGETGEQNLPLLGFHQVRPGLELAMAELPESRQKGSGALLVLLRIDPARHDFALSMAAEAGAAHSFAGWSRRDDLRAGINASMYLPDMRTSTGFMRNKALVNNDKLGARLGAFFLAGPRNPDLAAALIIDRHRPGWRALLEEYDIVVQNYRFMDEKGKALWKPDGQTYSMAVVGQDGAGRILFILSQEPLSAERFAFYLSALPLDLRSVMYVEGGAQAGLFLRLEKDDAMQLKDAGAALPGASGTSVDGGTVHVWKGRRSLLNTPGKADAVLPNVIGIRRDF
ncbi:phosphodiester glycosidase family protein [Desulfovibrio sp. OttesenSCG-928-G11]|nr:phosphodiester glycosidase family protein [Desulfovibrio sp. OttesenSCG-928-G11]